MKTKLTPFMKLEKDNAEIDKSIKKFRTIAANRMDAALQAIDRIDKLIELPVCDSHFIKSIYDVLYYRISMLREKNEMYRQPQL